ncbi:MAG: MFS transporter [Pseudomonadota bacterium]
MQRHRIVTVGKLGTAVTIAYASTYYLPAIIAKDIAQSLGVLPSTVFLAFSVALLISAVLGPLAGRMVDSYGGRTVLATTSLIFAAGLAALACSQGPYTLFFAWMLIGVAMAAGFYEVAFSSLVKLYGTDSRSAITGITLIAGFASTIGWPLTTWLNVEFGWRWVCLAWTGIHLAIALPLNLLLPTSAEEPVSTVLNRTTPPPVVNAAAPPPATAWLLAFVFGVTWFISTAMAAHLPRLLQANGVGLAAAVGFASLVGPAQVAGRLLEYGLLRNVNPLVSARIASLAHATGALIFLAAGVPAGIVFTVLHGAGNGVMTIANGTLPLVFFGSDGYGARQGLLMMPARFAQALAPFFFGLAIEHFGASALWGSIALGLLAFLALLALGMESKSVRQL